MNKMNLQKICLMALFSLLFVATGCKDYKDDVNRLDNEIEALKGNLDKMKSELTTKINEAGSSVEGAIDKKINALNIDEKIMAKLDAYDGTVDGKIDARLAKYDKMIDGKIDAKLDAIDGKIDGKINVKLADYVKAQDLEAYKAEMKKELDELKKKVEQASDATEFESYKKLVNDKFSEIDSKLEALGVKFELLSRRLSSLVAVTDFYVNGVQTWNFAPLRAECFTVVPNMVAKYHLNPSTVTLKDIDVDKIKFNIIKAKETLRAEKMPTINIDKKAISIKDGVLCIPLSIPDVEKFSTSGTFYKFAIQVPIADKYLHEEGKEMSDPFITSDYVRIASDEMVAGTDMFLALKGADNKAIKDTKLATSVEDAKAENVNGIDSKTSDDPRIINLPYGEKISLKDKIIAVMSDYSKFDTEMYGLQYMFDLKDAKTGKDIEYLRGGNKTDQQKFIVLKDDSINAKTFSKAEIEAAQGRTPIVHVYVVNQTKPDCHILDAYVKIHILDKPLPKAIVTKEYDFGTDTVKCDNKFLDTITVKYMNEEVYTAIALSKTEFHKVYTSYMLMPKNNNGHVDEVKNPDNQETDTYLIRYAFTNEVMWKLLNGKNNVVATDTLVYKSSMPTLYGDVKIPLKVKFIADKKIAFTDANLVKNYWYADKDGKMRIVRHNIAVPESGETNSDKAIFTTSLLNPFTQFRPDIKKNDKLNDLVLNSVKPGLRGETTETNNDNYVFTFYKDQPELMVGDMKYKLTVSDEGKSLMSGTEVVAKILPDNKLELQNDSEVAKALLNEADNNLKMRIGIMYYPCGMEKPERAYAVQVNGQDYYTIEFRKPIYMVPNVQDGFRDGVNFGEKGSWIDIAKLANLYDWRNNDEANDDYSFVKYPWFYDYYKVENMEVDVDRIMVNINGKDNWEPIALYPQLEFKPYVEKVEANGQVVKVKMKNEDGTEYEQALDKTYAKYGYMTYRNNDNNVKAFSIKFPLTVVYKWGKISTMVEVPVNKTVNSAPTSVR